MTKKRLIVAVCTFNRAQALERLIRSLIENASDAYSVCEIGLTVVDDSKDGNAEAVVHQFEDAFPLGLVYLNTASGNISIARNAALENAGARGDWVAMTDDDCEAATDWLRSLLDTQERFDADAVTGLMLRRPDGTAPDWLLKQGFLTLGEFQPAEGERLSTAFTNNCLLRSRWLQENSQIRFDSSLGTVGGEDMVFFGSAHSRGLRIVFSKKAIVFEYEPAARLTFQYQIWRYFWHGNSSTITQIELGKPRGRMLIHSAMTCVRALGYAPKRLLAGREPHMRFTMALIAEGVGKLVGCFGFRVKHH